MQEMRKKISASIRMDEKLAVLLLLEEVRISAEQKVAIAQRAAQFITNIRQQAKKTIGMDNFLQEFQLNADEGIALMCLAEALLRIPDKTTIDRLIKDKLSGHDWQAFLAHSSSTLISTTAWALDLTGKTLSFGDASENKVTGSLSRFFQRASMPLIRTAVMKAMDIMGQQFITGKTIEEAIKHAKVKEKIGYCYSYDMLGEAARTMRDADRYFQAYKNAISKVGAALKSESVRAPSVSIKLSALHPRYSQAQKPRVMREMVPKLLELLVLAKSLQVDISIDAEEANRLDLMLDVFTAVYLHNELSDWQGLGLAVQAYGKAAYYAIDYLAELAKQGGRRINIRLVKGAYWDSEIKDTQIRGLNQYPVFTRKASTDISYCACAQKILSMPEYFYAQFATHNAYTVATILELAVDSKAYEFQCLHGMGQALYQQIVPEDKLNLPCRIYAPVGGHEELLAYLVRRLLENGANSSFVNQVVDNEITIEQLTADPLALDQDPNKIVHEKIPLPSAIFKTRKNSPGLDLDNPQVLADIQEAIESAAKKAWKAAPIISGKEDYQSGNAVYLPSNVTQILGHVQTVELTQVDSAIEAANVAYYHWSRVAVSKRYAVLNQAADLFEKHQVEFISLAVLEAGKTLQDAIDEVREAIDFLRYYADEAQRLQTSPQTLQGYTGETNQLSLVGRGVMLCISPWNFPLAIFTGQVAACLAVGNTVLAKPAGQTTLIAALAVRLLHAAGVPADALHLLPGSGSLIGGHCIPDARLKGVLLTGSNATAQVINQQIAQRTGAMIPFIAETGGQNAMIVDSTALLEQVVVDVLSSAFGSAGQRCSALRVLFIQEDIREAFLNMLKGAMAELTVFNPQLISTDLGPVIDQAALSKLQEHADRMQKEAKLIYQCQAKQDLPQGYYFMPCAYQIESIEQLTEEIFGPFLHVISFKRDALDQVIDDINNTGYGLTLGIHSRIQSTVDYIRQRIQVGNCYVNRSMTGAIVGLQPFGGEGLSGTGPKAGGPHYLLRLCYERAFTVNTSAIGGNASLLMLD